MLDFSVIPMGFSIGTQNCSSRFHNLSFWFPILMWDTSMSLWWNSLMFYIQIFLLKEGHILNPSGTVINWQISRGPRAISISFESGPNKLLHNSSSPKEAVLILLFMGHPITFWPLQEQLPFCQKLRHYHFPYWVCCVHKSRALL